jgi:hypothetical protein
MGQIRTGNKRHKRALVTRNANEAAPAPVAPAKAPKTPKTAS